MTTYPYANTMKSLKGILNKIPLVRVPKLADNDWLSSQGFGHPNDFAVINVLRFLGFVDESGMPTEIWRDFKRDAKSKTVMAKALKGEYADLFAQHPNAGSTNNGDLKDFFAAHSDAGEQVLNRMVNTFTTLCEYAEFDQVVDHVSSDADTEDISGSSDDLDSRNGLRAPALPEQQPALHIDIQIHISPSADADQIDNIFRSMAKHLYSVDAN